jgi:hypothetical protein
VLLSHQEGLPRSLPLAINWYDRRDDYREVVRDGVDRLPMSLGAASFMRGFPPSSGESL